MNADGVERDQVRTSRRRLETTCGDVTIERRLYQAPGVEVATVYTIARWQRTSADVLHGLRDARDAHRPRPTNKACGPVPSAARRT